MSVRVTEDILRPLKPLLVTPRFWRSGDVGTPLAERGVRLDWVARFARTAVQARDDIWRQYESAVRARQHGPWGIPPIERPAVQSEVLSVKDLVRTYVNPLTSQFKCSLYARVPHKFRGKPTTFVSHTWDTDLGGPHSSLDTIALPSDTFVWLDWVCYNQHALHNRHIARDMKELIGRIGSVSCALTPEPFFHRSWCVWEIICARRTGAKLDVFNQINRIKLKYWGTEQHYLPPRFDSVDDLVASLDDDQQMIADAIQADFGSVENADAYVRSILPEY